jgi:hypothetical protein
MAMINHTFQYIIRHTLEKNQLFTTQLRTHGDSYFLIQKIFSKHASEYKLLFNDSYWNSDWANDLVQVTNFAGTPEFPAKLLKEVILPPSSLLKYKIQNGSDAQDIELVLQGQKIFDKKEMPKARYRQYVKTFVLPAGQTIPQIIELDVSKPFYVQKLLGYKKDPEARLVLTMFDISSLSGRRIIDTDVDIDNIFGRAMRPNIIPELRLDPACVITTTIKNTEDFDTEFQLALDGYEQ